MQDRQLQPQHPHVAGPAGAEQTLVKLHLNENRVYARLVGKMKTNISFCPR